MKWRGGVRKILVVTSSVLLVSACSGDSGNGGGTAQSQTPPPTAQSQTPPPKALSLKEYGAMLARAIDPLSSALKRLAEAKAYKGLNGRVTAVETAAAKAVTVLSPITPPAELAQEHSQLVSALQAFHDELNGRTRNRRETAELPSNVSDLPTVFRRLKSAELGCADFIPRERSCRAR
jgi:hypothetical protein